jgi:hypothetical protein
LASPLDPFIPAFDIRERHSIVVRAPAETVFAAAAAFDFQSLGFIRAIIRARQFLLHSTRVERQPQPFLQEALKMGWGVLAQEPGACFVAGARCQPWLGDVVFTPVSPAEFAGYAEPNQVKIAWTLEVESLGPASSRLSTETRAVATDETARRRFRRYWRWARFGIVTIRLLMLPAIRRQAEREWRRTAECEVNGER